MKKWSRYTEEHPAGGCFALIVAIAIAVFFMPWVVMHAWYLIAVCMFGAPVMPYWTAFFGTWACAILFGNKSYRRSE